MVWCRVVVSGTISKSRSSRGNIDRLFDYEGTQLRLLDFSAETSTDVLALYGNKFRVVDIGRKQSRVADREKETNSLFGSPELKI